MSTTANGILAALIFAAVCYSIYTIWKSATDRKSQQSRSGSTPDTPQQKK